MLQQEEIFLTNDAYRVINYAYLLMNVIWPFIKRPVSPPKISGKSLNSLSLQAAVRD